MQVFFQANPDVIEQLKNQYQLIIKFIEKNQTEFFSNLYPEKLEKSDILIFNQIDAVIIEGTKLNHEASYILALALSQKKPVLILVSKGSALPEQINKVIKDKKFKDGVVFKYYKEETIETIINQFFDYLGVSGRREQPNIKFTLRLTPSMEKYLSWKIVNTNMKKADYLRIILNKAIDEDENHKKFLKNIE